MSKKRQRPTQADTSTPGRRFEPVRWSIGQAAYEFGIDHRSLSKRLTQADLAPGEDGRFSTRQIAAAVWGDADSESLRKLTQEADKLEIQNRRARGELIEADAVYRHFEGVFVSLRQRIMASKLTREEQDDLMLDLQRLTADEARKRPIGGSNGQAGEDPDAAAEA